MQSEDVLNALEKYIANPKGFVLMNGTNGVGKTHCALKVYESLATYKLPFYDHEEAWFISQTDLNLLRTKRLEERREFELLEELAHSRFLVLDDLGTRVPSVSFADFLYGLADKRYSELATKGTMITTNLNAIQIREQFGDAFFSRIASGLVFKLTGKDRRFAESALK